MSARSCSTKARSWTKRAKHLPPRPRRAGVIPASGSHWLSSVLGAALRCDPQPSASASFRSDHGCSSPLYGGAISGLARTRACRMASEAQKGILAGRARLRRPDEPTEPMARRRDRRANPFRPLRKPHFSSELRILVNERAAGRGRAPLGARQNRHVDSIAGCDRQEMGEDGGLFAVGEVCNDEAIAGERLEVEDIGARLYVRYERVGVRVEIGAAHNKPERAQLANHVATAGAGLEDRAFDSDRTAERWDDPIRVEGEVSVALEAA